MIIAGDRIDSMLGVTFGISTMAAAGLGNLLSDIVGVSVGGITIYINIYRSTKCFIYFNLF
jgi:hypothetical protein